MSAQLSLTLGLVMVACSLTSLAVALDFGSSTRSLVRARLQRVHAKPTQKKQRQRQLATADEQLGLLRLFVRRSGVQKLERNLLLAGKASTWRLSSLVMLKVVGPGILLVPMLLWVRSGPSLFRATIFLGALVLAYALPSIIVGGRASERQNTILYELPDTLDQVTISIESGLGFEAALARIGQNSKGPLGEEIARVVQDSRLGVSRRDAYTALVERTDVDDLKRFLKAIIQAEEFGVSIAKVVRTQAEELRTKRRQRAEEKGAKVALKLLFPMLFCMFPVLFILILTPAIVNMGKVL
jgi:tight adherence protein C